MSAEENDGDRFEQGADWDQPGEPVFHGGNLDAADEKNDSEEQDPDVDGEHEPAAFWRDREFLTDCAWRGGV
jgi:hypothetical protein